MANKTIPLPWPWRVLWLFPALLVWAIATWGVAPMTAAEPLPSAPVNGASNILAFSPHLTSPICRFGANVTSDINNFDTTTLRLGWYLDYTARVNPPLPNGAIYTPMIRLSQVRVAGERTDDYTYTPSGTTLQNAIATNPGANWIIGNEPDRIEVQDDIEPHVYAAAYHELYHLIKTADPAARIVAGTIVQPTPVRLTYLDKVLVAYLDQFNTPMPVDAWNIHNFILNEVSCEYDDSNCWGAGIPPGVDVGFGEILTIDDSDNMPLFAERIVRFRQWMKARGYAHVPLYLTEYGVLMPPEFGFPAERVNAFMNATYDYMMTAQDPLLGYPGDDYRLVQKWSWFSTYDPGFNGDLFESEPPYAMTAMGQNFANYTDNIPEEIDLYPWKLASQASPIVSGGNPVTLTIQATLANSGNLSQPTGPTLVRFYNGDPQNGGTQIGDDQNISLTGCGQITTATITWPNVNPGVYTVYVWVDSLNSVAETNETNNLRSFSLLVADPSLYLPLITQSRPTP